MLFVLDFNLTLVSDLYRFVFVVMERDLWNTNCAKRDFHCGIPRLTDSYSVITLGLTTHRIWLVILPAKIDQKFVEFTEHCIDHVRLQFITL